MFSYINQIKIKDKIIYLRPENIRINHKSDFHTQVVGVVFLGDRYMLKANFQGYDILFFHNQKMEKNQFVKIDFDFDKKLLFN